LADRPSFGHPTAELCYAGKESGYIYALPFQQSSSANCRVFKKGRKTESTYAIPLQVTAKPGKNKKEQENANFPVNYTRFTSSKKGEI
jgi:hypothetical protein